MTGHGLPGDWTKAAFEQDANPSFADFVQRLDPGLLPSTPPAPDAPRIAVGTTILALTFADGVVVAGDRRATAGFQIADRKIEKVYPADEHSAIAIAGAAGPAMDMVKLFQTELEHYEKVEGEKLSLEGKANKLAAMVKANFPMAMQGLLVVPLFAGYDLRRGEGRLYRYDGVGGRYEETEYYADGSGGKDARGSLRARWKPGLSREESIIEALEALLDASEEDTATGGPDVIRGIYPSVAIVTQRGYEPVSDDEIRTLVDGIIARRRERMEGRTT
jgi:proteasome beta subunit